MQKELVIKNNRSTYPGGKGASGVHQQIINLIPPHEIYIETHLGAGSIMRYKKPAIFNIGVDIDPEVTKAWVDFPATIINEDAAVFLEDYFIDPLTGNEFIYCDPPYLMETRKSGKLYDFEYDEQDHINLLSILKTIPCMVMISGYYSDLYTSMLSGWNTHTFQSQTRNGVATEWVWFNYSPPEKLHDYSYLGNTFRERERIKKKKDRWVKKFLNTSVLERNAILQAILETQDLT